MPPAKKSRSSRKSPKSRVDFDRSGLEPKQRIFCQKITAGFKVADAYVAAGYSVTTKQSAQANGSRLLAKPNVQTYIQFLQKKAEVEAGVNNVRVLRQYSAIAFSNITDYIEISNESVRLKDIEKLSPDKQSAIAEISVNPGQFGNSYKVKLHPKMPALAFLTEHLGMKDGLDLAIAAFRSLGYEVRPTDGGYQMLDFYQAQIDQGIGLNEFSIDEDE